MLIFSRGVLQRRSHEILGESRPLKKGKFNELCSVPHEEKIAIGWCMMFRKRWCGFGVGIHKPLSVLKRLIEIGSNPGDIVLDVFM